MKVKMVMFLIIIGRWVSFLCQAEDVDKEEQFALLRRCCLPKETGGASHCDAIAVDRS